MQFRQTIYDEVVDKSRLMMSPTVDNFSNTQANFAMRRTGVQSEGLLAKPGPSVGPTASLPGVKTVTAGVNGLNIGNEPVKKESKYIAEFFHREPCLYSHEVFKKAAELYSAMCHEPRNDPIALRKHQEKQKEKLPELDFQNDNEKRLVLSLVFATLKCKYENIPIVKKILGGPGP